MRHLNPGEKLQNGRYTINSILGAGGFGITYLGTEKLSNQQIAIKTLNATVQGNDNFLDLQNKFIKEAFLLAKCSHPHMELQPENRPQTIQEFLDLLLPKPVQIPQTKKDDLSSDRGIDYSKLRDFLKAGKWEEADIETGKVIYQVANRSKEGWLRVFWV